MPQKNSDQQTINERTIKGSVDKPEQILQGAMQEFLTHGYAGTSMDKVAAAAGVSKQTLYSYFQDKEGLFTALIERMASQRIQELLGNKPLQGEPSLVLRQVATRVLTLIMNDQKHISFVRLVIAESGRFPNLAQAFIRNGAMRGIQTISSYLAEHPELQIRDPEATARIFIGSLISFILTQEILQGKHIMPMESDRLIDSLIDLVLSNAE